MMLLCIGLVGVGGLMDIEEENTVDEISEEEKNERILNLILAIISSAVTGLIFTFNALSIHYAIITGLPIE